MRALYLVFIVVVVAIHPAFAQKVVGSAEIKGEVYLSQHTPAPTGTMVLVERADSGIVANLQVDSRGKFEVSGLEPRVYTLRIRVRGYESYEESIDLTVNNHEYVVINLRPVTTRKTERLPPAGAADAVSARDAAIPREAVKEFDRGKKLLTEKNDLEGAASHLRKAIKLHDNFPQAYILLGVALGAQQKFPEAEEAYTHAIKLDEHAADAYLGLGTLQNQQKKFADAERTLTRAVEMKPDSFEAHYELGKSLWALQRNADAEPHAQKAVTLEPRSAQAHLLMGNVLLRKHDQAGALREFKESLRAEPGNPYAEATRKVIKQLEDQARTRMP